MLSHGLTRIQALALMLNLFRLRPKLNPVAQLSPIYGTIGPVSLDPIRDYLMSPTSLGSAKD